MITIEKIETWGIKHAIRGMRNPMNSWDKSDSLFGNDGFVLGTADLELMQKLYKAGTDHRKFMRMINVTADVTAPLYWWKEFDTYKVGTVANSCSTMHKIHAKEFTIDDFSIEHLNYDSEVYMQELVNTLNYWRDIYNNGGEHLDIKGNLTKYEPKSKNVWWQIIQLLPSSYNQKRTVQLNYEVLTNICRSRSQHKLDEWVEFCKTIKKELPYFDMITKE